MGTNSWIGTSGNWTTSSDWSTGAVPVSTDDVTINTGLNGYTITLDSVGMANSLTLGSLTAPFDVFKLNGTLTLEGDNPPDGAIFGAFYGGFDLDGDLILNNTSTESVVMYGPGTLAGTIQTALNTPELDFDINNTVAVGNLTLVNAIAFGVGNTVVAGAGAVLQEGNVTMDRVGTVFPSLDIFTSWEIENSVSIGPNPGDTPGNLFNEGGTLIKAGDNGTAYIDAFYSEDTHHAQSTILIDGGTLQFGGTVTDIFRGQIGTTGSVGGAGTLAFSSGVYAAFYPTVTLEIAGIVFSGATLETPTFLNYGSQYVQTTGTLLPAGTFELSGVSQFSGGTIDLGTLNISGYAQTFGHVTVDGDGTVLDTGTIDQDSTVTLGSTESGQSGFIDIAAGATWHINSGSGDDILLVGASPLSQITNAGLLEMTVNGTVNIHPDLVDTGTIVVGPGPAQSAAEVDLLGAQNVFSGPINGFGILVMGTNTSNTFQFGASVSVATLELESNLTLDTNVTFTGDYIEKTAFPTTLYLDGSDALFLGQAIFDVTGTENFAYITGGGTITLGCPSTTPAVIEGSGVQLLDTTELINAGALKEAASSFTVGDTLGNPASVLNTGVWTLISSSVTSGVSTNSSFVNSGTISSAGASYIEVPNFTATPSSLLAVQNESTLTIQAFTVETLGTSTIGSNAELILGGGPSFLTHYYTVGGAISGPGTLDLTGGNAAFNYTIVGNTNITTSTLLFGRNTSITLGGNLSYDGSFSQEGLNSSLNLGGYTFTVGGGSVASPNVIGGSTIGLGTLVTSAGGFIQVVGNPILSSGAWENAGTVSQVSDITIGDTLFDPATVINEVGATYTIQGSSDIMFGSSPSDEFVNQGTFIGAGTNVVEVGGHGTFVNDGTVIDRIEFGGSVITDPSDTGLIQISPNGQVQFDQFVDAGQVIQFVTNSGSMILQDAPSFDASVLGFQAGDTIFANNFISSVTGHSYADDVLSILHNTTVLADINFSGAYSDSEFLVTTGSDSTVITTTAGPPCYAEGTRIRTPHGETPVEHLRPGDLVQTADGVARPISWIGRRRIDIARHPSPELVRPVRIAAHAFGPEAPHRALRLSPDHAVLLDGQLIPIRLLVNGATIAYDTAVPAVTYFHIELETHDILLAENLPAESYLDTGNRSMFEGPAMALLPDFANDQARREAGSCRPFLDDPARVEPLWHALADHAAALGHTLASAETTTDPALRIQIGARTISPIRTRAGTHIFLLPSGGDARLVSRAAAPCDTRPWIEDRRRLGVMVQRITIRHGTASRSIPLDHPGLTDGWWRPEGNGGDLWRWTDGSAALPLPDGALTLEITLGEGALYPVERRLVG